LILVAALVSCGDEKGESCPSENEMRELLTIDQGIAAFHINASDDDDNLCRLTGGVEILVIPGPSEAPTQEEAQALYENRSTGGGFTLFAEGQVAEAEVALGGYLVCHERLPQCVHFTLSAQGVVLVPYTHSDIRALNDGEIGEYYKLTLPNL
jgi:hypothetical protein